MTQQGFLRLASNPKVFLSDALPLPGAWQAYDILLGDVRACFAPEPREVEDEWRKLTGDESFSTKIWNDAFLAAFAKLSGLELVTFDRGFLRYPDLDVRILKTG